ncbi:MAG: glycoside hydrolase family 32 protein, partial [Planctomycetes bacterium]|nr:glycoside hydrolase family 32 protein [Planctomycetota bacterium]
MLNVDGLTRWTSSDLCANSCLWSPSPDNWFPLLPYRWLLTPYSRVVYGEPGQTKRIVLRVRVEANGKQKVQLRLEFPDGAWPARLERTELTVRPKRVEEVTVTCPVPPASQQRICHVRATPVEAPDFSTYSRITVIGGEAPAARPLTMPLVLKPYQHENEQFGYLPDYPIDWEPYFDLDNRPFIRGHRSLRVLRDGQWQLARSPQVPFVTGGSRSKVCFDRDNDVYTLTVARKHAWLLHSTDGGRTFNAYDLGRSGSLDIEQFAGHNVPDGPPAVARSVQRERDPKLFWRRLSDLELIVPEKRNGRAVIPEPVLLSRKSLGVGSHSGIPPTIVSRGSRVHVVWAEATDPKEKVPGVPTYVVTYDRKERRLLG